MGRECVCVWDRERVSERERERERETDRQKVRENVENDFAWKTDNKSLGMTDYIFVYWPQIKCWPKLSEHRTQNM